MSTENLTYDSVISVTDLRKSLEVAQQAWEQSKAELEEAHTVYQPLREIRVSDKPFTADWHRYIYTPTLERVLYAIEAEKQTRKTFEDTQMDYLFSNQYLEEQNF